MASTKVPIELSSTPGIVDNSNATAITIDSSENVGIGTSNPTGTLDVTSSSGSGGPSIRVSATGAPTDSKYWAIQSSPSDLAWGTLALRPYNDSGTLKNNGLVINSSGNVGIGTSSPSSYYSKSLVVSAANEDGITIVAANGATTYANYLMFADGTTGNEAYRGWLGYDHNTDSFSIASHGFLRIYSGSTTQERMRIGSNGHLLVNTTTDYGQFAVETNVSGGNPIGCYIYSTDTVVDAGNVLGRFSYESDASLANGSYFLQFNDAAGTIGSITSTASSSQVAFNTSSDERLKENIVDAGSQLDIIKQVQVREFDWKKNGNHQVGMIAQELNNIIPEVVTVGGESEFENPWSIDYGKLTPHLIKAIQEQQVLIEQLQAEVALLKGE